MKKLARKVARAAKVACQFKYTCTFEYIDLVCVDGWKPENLQVVWVRGHRRIDSPTVKWVPKSESGNTVEGRATFDPPISSSLLVTLYQKKEDQQDYEVKEYKFYIENEGAGGKKILASFNCNIADFAGIPSERHALDMTFKPVSKKISKALLGLTMESEFLKKGKSSDDDMMSTFSRVSANAEGDDAMGDDDDDDDPTTSTSSFKNIPVNTSVSSLPSDSLPSTVTNGIADESVTPEASNAPVGILKKSSKVSTGNGPIEAVIQGQAVVEGEKANLKQEGNVFVAVAAKNDEAATTGITTNGNAVAQTDHKDQMAHSDVMTNGTTVSVTEIKTTVEDSANSSNLPLHSNDVSMPPITVEPVPSVTIEPVPPVNVEPVPPVNVEPVPPVTIEPVPPVNVEPVPPVNVEPVPPVTIEPVPSVNVEPVPPVTIEPVPLVTIEPVPPVTVEPVPPVTIEPVPPVTIEPVPPVTIEPVPPVTIEPVPPVTIEPVPLVTTEPVPPVTVEPVPPVTVEPVPPVTVEPVPPVTIEPVPPVTVKPVSPVTVDQELQSKAGATGQTNIVSSDNRDVTQAKTKKNKFGKSKSPPTQVTTSPEATLISKFVAGPTMEGACWLPDDIALVDANGQSVPKTILDQTDIIALYFSAEWCGPCRKFLPKLLKFYNYLKQEEQSFQILYVSSDNTKEAMLAYMKEQNMPWVGLDFESPLGEQLRADFRVSAIPLLLVISRNGEIINDSAKKPVDSVSSSEEEMTKLYNKWICKLLEIKGLPIPAGPEPEKKKGLLSGLFGGKKKDKQQQQQPGQTDTSAAATTTTKTDQDEVDEAPPSKQSEKATEELLHQKEKLEHERKLERQVVEEKTKKLHVTLELNAQMQKELEEKEEKIRILEAKNETLSRTADTKTDEIENLKQKISMLEQELLTKADEEKKLLSEKKELLANINLHGWLCKKGIKGPTANTWRRRYFKIEEGCKLTYYKTAGDGPPQGYIDIDKIISVKTVSGAQQDKNNCTFHVATDGRTYELQAHDEATMNKWISSLQYLKEWRAKQKREANK